MKINVKYMTKIKKIVGIATEIIEYYNSITIQEFIINILCKRHKELSNYILDDNGSIRKFVLIFIRNLKVEFDVPIKLKDGDEIIIMTPITGG